MPRSTMTEMTPVTCDQKAVELEERRRATVLRNSLVDNNEEIADRILANAEFQTFPNAFKIIEQGAKDECVYFILSGTVDVFINGRHIDSLNAPRTVGEMAANKAGQPRSADVVVKSQELEVLVLSGTEFRNLTRDYQGFSEKLQILLGNLLNDKIVQLGGPNDKEGLPWAHISAVCGGLAGLVSSGIWWHLELKVIPIVLASLGSSLAVFVLMLLVNPAHRYRNMFSAAGFGMILLLLYAGSSLAVTAGLMSDEIPFLFDFRTSPEANAAGIGLTLLTVVGLFALAWLSAHYDSKLK